MEDEFPFGIFRPEKQDYLFQMSRCSPEMFGWNDQKSHVPLLSNWTFRKLVEMVNKHHNMEIPEMPVGESNGSRHFISLGNLQKIWAVN